MSKKKFTFKTKKPTGKWRAFSSPFHYIKYKGKQCGRIEHDFPHKIRLTVIKDDINEDGNPNCSWKWVRIKIEFDSVQEAKIFLNENIEQIFERMNLHFFE